MRVLITGGSGMVGRNIIERLEGRHEIVAPVRGSLDLMDAGAVSACIRDSKPEIVIHCAGLVGGIQANMREPARFLVENFEMGKNVVLGAANAGVKKLVNLGSSCMYPRNSVKPLTEDLVLTGELEPTNEGYAIAKIAVQRLCAYIRAERPELSYKTLLPCNLYGKWDKFDPKNSHMVPAVIRKLHEAKKNGLETVEIWGSGQARREFLYAGDLADFFDYALEIFEEMPDLLNFGLGYDYTVDEYYHAVADVVGYSGSFIHDAAKPEGMSRKLVDVSRLSGFGWKASTALSDGLRLTYEYFLQQEACR